MSLSREIKEAKAKAVGGKKDRCRKGKSCSATCISGWKACLVEMPDILSESLNKLTDKVKSKISQIGRNPERLIPGEKREEFKNKKVQQFLAAKTRLINEMQKLSSKGDKRGYNKIEDKLLKLQEKVDKALGDRLKKNPYYQPVKKGEIWDSDTITRGNVRLEKFRKITSDLNRKLEKAALTGNKDEYDKIEKTLVKVTSKTGPKLGVNSSVREGAMWSKYEGTLPNLLGQGLAKPGSNTKMEVDDLRGLELLTMVRGNKLKLSINPDSLAFKVNDSYLSSGDLPLRDRIAIVRELKKQFPEVVRNIKDGTVLAVSAARGDGQEDMREGAYIDFGFSKPNRWGDMFGRVENGKIVAIDEDEYNANYSATFQ